ncbi:MAG: phospholipid scramblase-related protein [Myxococcaceae bacterium]
MTDELELDWGSRKPRNPNDPDSGGNDASPPLQRSIVPPPAGRGVPPGHPSTMPEGLLFRVGRFFTDRTLGIKQEVEMAQALVGWDQANRYSVRGEDGANLFNALEQRQGLLASLSRNFNPFYKNTTDCLTDDGSLFLRLVFPFAFFFRRCEVLAWNEAPLGVIQNRFHLLKYRADLLNTTGAVLLEVHGPWLKIFSFTDWVFEVRKGERVVARIKKHWGGFFREAFTTADRLSIEFEPELTDPRLRSLIFAAALMVDASAFEQKRRSGAGTAVDLLNLLD